MANFQLQIQGLQNLRESLDDLEADLTGERRFLVGTNVSYAIFLEFGTKKMDPRPFFRPAIAEIRRKGVDDFLQDNTQLSAKRIENLDSLVRALALALERRVKQIITEKGIIDTGTLRASIAAVPGGDKNDLATEADLPDTGSGPPYPSDFGPEIREDIEVKT
jgi:phage gpG-like protein